MVSLACMMMNRRKHSIEARRFADRRLREDEAPKLHDEIPTLKSLVLVFEERSGAGANKYTRRVVVERAPALFLMQCGDPRCVDGEHDLTAAVMRELRNGKTTFHGSDECGGSIGTAPCARVLHFDATAEYGASVVQHLSA